MAFENVTESVGKKLGPFPVWVWGVLIGGAFVIWYWVSQRDAGQSAVADAVSETGTIATPSGDFSTVPVIPSGEQTQDENTNAEWLIQAVNAVGNAGVSFVTAQTALTKYINGQTISSAEKTIVDRAIGLVGPPPEGVASAPDVTPEPSSPSVDYSTVTTISARKTAPWGATIPITVRVRWKNGKGHANPFPTTGVMWLNVGNQRVRLAPIAGTAVRVVRVTKRDTRVNGNRLVLSAEWSVNPQYKTKSSGSQPHIVTMG